MYTQNKESSCFIVNGKLAANKALLVKNAKLELKIVNNFKHLMDLATTITDALSLTNPTLTQENNE